MTQLAKERKDKRFIEIHKISNNNIRSKRIGKFYCLKNNNNLPIYINDTRNFHNYLASLVHLQTQVIEFQSAITNLIYTIIHRG